MSRPATTSGRSLIALGYFFQRPLGDLQCLESRFQIFTRMGFEKFAALNSESLDIFPPPRGLAVRL
jgi:hypothetical protein